MSGSDSEGETRPHGRNTLRRRQQAGGVRETVRNDAFRDFDLVPQRNNNDEELLKDKGFPGFASFSKTLKHDDKGVVEEESFQSLVDAIEEDTQAAFEKVILGGGERLLVNPLNATSFQLIGNDSNGARMAPAPIFASKNTAVDMVERYWMALARDVRFSDYATDPVIQRACIDLQNIGFHQEFGFACTPNTIFRGPYEGCFDGPHVSQFLLKDFTFGNQPIRQLQRYPVEGKDFMTDFENWRRVNNGDEDPTGTDVDELTDGRHILSLRDAGQWVHVDFPHQSGLWATIILLGLQEEGVSITDASPYVNGGITTASPFGSLGGPDVTVQAALAGVYALKHAWFQKWCVHRRLRPEVYAERIELFRRGLLGSSPDDPLNDDLFNKLFDEGAEVWRRSFVLQYILEHNQKQNREFDRADKDGTYLLPMGFPEGSPAHPSYPGGHSVFVAAAATVAKALFKDRPFPNPMVPTPDGQKLVRYQGTTPLMVHGELNKLIANVTLFRDGAGMHWRSDGTPIGPNSGQARTHPERPGVDVFSRGEETGGNLLGEKLAISMLRDLKRTYREELGTLEFRGLQGNLIRI